MHILVLRVWHLTQRSMLFVLVLKATATIITVLLEDHKARIIVDLRLDSGWNLPASLACFSWIWFIIVELVLILPSREVLCLIEHCNSRIVLLISFFTFLRYLLFDLCDVVVISIVGLHRINWERLHATHLLRVMTEVRVEHLRTICIHDLFA